MPRVRCPRSAPAAAAQEIADYYRLAETASDWTRRRLSPAASITRSNRRSPVRLRITTLTR
jgi:hypothetical protein